MLRQSLIYLLLTIMVVVFTKYAHLLILYIDMLYAYINVKLNNVFALTGLGITLRKIVLLALIPLLIAGIPALIYWLIKKKTMPYVIELTWFLWLIIVLSNVLIH